jgi:hypothetical protein
MEGGTGEVPGTALEIGEDPIAPFLADPVELAAEKGLVVHAPLRTTISV